MFNSLTGQNKMAHNRKSLHQENVWEVAMTIEIKCLWFWVTPVRTVGIQK